MAAPRATASSGFRSVAGNRPNIRVTARRTMGIRVVPPTSTTSFNWSSTLRLVSQQFIKQRILFAGCKSPRGSKSTQHVLDKYFVKVPPSKIAVTRTGPDLNHSLKDLEYRDVESSTA